MSVSTEATSGINAVTRQVDSTYRLSAEDHSPELVFKAAKVKQIIGSLFRERLTGQIYDPVTGTQTAKALASDIRDRVKALGFSRHKTIVQVSLCQQTGQSFASVSRCLWDSSQDTTVSECFENKSLVCEGQVHGLYYE